MAWISVHEELVGRKLRVTAKRLNCSQNEAIGILIHLWLWGIKNADKDGKIRDADKSDLEEVVAPGKSKRLKVNNIVDALIDCGWINERVGALYLHDWEDWQEYWYKYRERKAHDRIRKRVMTKVSQDSDFNEFWAAYPRKEGKGMAYREYSARQQEGYTSEELLTAAKNYAIMCASEHREMKYIKLAKTFLGESAPFLDYVDAASGKGKSSRTSEDDFEGLPSS